MIVDDFVSEVLNETSEKMPGVDQAALRRVVEDVVSGYELQQRDGVGRPSDVLEKIEVYLRSKKLDGLSDGTLANYRYHLARFARFVTKRTTAITHADLRAFLAHIVETRKIKNSSLENEKTMLRSFFGWLEDEEYIKKSPARKLRPTKVERRLRTSLSLEQLELMRDACATPRERCMLELFYSSGMRLAELASVDIPMIDWPARAIRVIGKGNKERVIYFSEKAAVYIKKYLAVRGSFESQSLFVTVRSPHHRLGVKSIQTEISRIASRANIRERVSPHKLRHSFATQGSRSGMSLTTLQELMGHSKIETTLGYIDADHLAAAYEHGKFMNQ